MSYYLSKNDVKVLKQTINTVNNISTGVVQGKRPTIKNAFAYAELTDEDANGLWSAKEVYFDETGTPIELTDGRTWGGDNPSIIVNGTVSTGQVMRVESYYLVDSSDEQLPVWVGSAVGGGGASMYRLLVNNDFTLALNGSNGVDVDLVNDQNVVITSAVTVTQRKYTTADFYAGEPLYAIDYSGGGYLLDPFLAGIGGTSA